MSPSDGAISYDWQDEYDFFYVHYSERVECCKDASELARQAANNGETNMNETIGHNNPPSELEQQKPVVQGIIDDAEATLTGIAVETAKQDAAVETLLKELKAAKKGVNDAHKSDKAPFLDGGNRIDAEKNALIDDIDRAIKVAQDCRTPYLQKQEEIKL